MSDKQTLIYYEILQYRPENLAILDDHFRVIALPDPSCDTPELLKQADVILAPLGFFLGKDKIDCAPCLKVIGSNTTGHPHIDVAYAGGKGVKVVTLKGHDAFLDTITPTAELAWGLIIALTRHIIPSTRAVLAGRWSRWPFGGRKMLSRMRLGVAGYGRLGKKVAAYALSFGMEVRYYDPFVPRDRPGIQRIDTLEALVKSCDIITVHIPHEEETENLFNRDIFNRMKQGAFFINTSRGELVDETALLQCLENGTLAGAAVDVLGGEFDPGFAESVKAHPLVRYAMKNPNLIITPHIGGSTLDAWQLTQEFTIRKVIEALEG